MRIIEFAVGKKRLELVAGLKWHPLKDSGSARVKEIAAFARETEGDCSFKVLRDGDSTHVGFSSKSDGGKTGQISTAALIADTLQRDRQARNVLVAMPLPTDSGTYMFVSVRGGIILADGDELGSRDEIKVRVKGDIAFGGWDLVVCPAEWGLGDSEEMEFDDFFTETTLKNPKKWTLGDTSLAWKKSIIPVLLLVAVMVAAVAGYSVWSKKRALAAALLLQQQQEAAAGQREAPAEPPKPWPTMASPLPFAAACAQALQETGTSAGNWSLSGITCEGGSLTVRWTKSSESAWISHLMAIRPQAVIFSDGLSASESRPAVATASNDFKSPIPPQKDVALRYYDLASRYGMAVRVDAPVTPPPPQALPGQVTSSAAPSAPPSWLELPVQVTTKIEPVQAIAVLDYPGLRIHKIEYAVKSGVMQYQLSGVQYVQP